MNGHLLGDLWQDLRYAARMFWKQPAFAAAAVLTLALGIGATTAIFSVVYGVLLKPLPFAEPERLVSLQHTRAARRRRQSWPGDLSHVSREPAAFEAIGAWDPTEVSITGRGDPERVEALLGQRRHAAAPARAARRSAGSSAPRTIRRAAPLRVVLTYGYWQRRFGGAENVVGQPLAIDGRPAEVIGVLPASFTFLRADPASCCRCRSTRNAPRGISFGFQALARLKPGVTLAQANADVGAHDLAAAAGVRDGWSCGRTCARSPTT